MWIAVTSAIIVTLLALFVPYRPTPRSTIQRARTALLLMLFIPAAWFVLAIIDAHRSEIFCRVLTLPEN
jgi:hypothetical protein